MQGGVLWTLQTGRPKWSVPFTQIRNTHPGEVGVMFCGNPMIASDLGDACYYVLQRELLSRQIETANYYCEHSTHIVMMGNMGWPVFTVIK
eukprot:g31796.t1